jgi:hypothetical protein
MTTPQDVERLSAYLDHQLSPAEKTRLEARLKQEPELQAALTDLQATLRLLRNLPTLKPPRNFTFSASQASKLSQRRSIFVRLRLATAVAMLALTTVVGGDLLSSLSLSQATAPAPQAQGAAEKTEPTAGEAGLSITQDNFAATEEQMMADATLSTPLPDEGETNTPEAGLSAPLATEASTDERIFSSTVALTETLPAPPTSTPMGVAESITAVPPGEVATESVSPPSLPPSPLPFVRYAEGGLGVLVVLLAAAAWLTRKG